MSLVHEMLERTATEDGGRTAVITGKREYGYTALLDEVRRVAGLFAALGTRKGDRIGIYLEKSIEEIVSIFGACAAGAVFVPINPALKEKQVLHIIEDAGIRILVTHPLKVRPFLDKLEALESVIYAAEGEAPAGVRCVSFSRAGEPSAPLPSVREADDAAILYTSGSTGKPKGVVLSHANITAGAESVAEYLGITREERILAVLPFSFDYGLNQMMSAFLTGALIVPAKFLFPEALVNVIHREKITGLAAIPTLWARLLEAKNMNDYAFEHLRYLTNSGGKLTAGQVRRLRKTFPAAKIFLMYGLTEAFRATYLDPSEVDRRPESIGKAVPKAEVFVVDENGKECPPGVVGELIQRGPLVSKGYWNKPEETRLKIRPNPLDDGYDGPACFSGDLVRKDEEGFLYFVGRRDEMIKTSGFRVSPQEIEDVALSSGAVREAVAFGAPDALLGQKIAVVVTFAASGGKAASLEQLKKHCQEQLPSHLLPAEYFFVEAMPLMANGKINRREVIELFLPKAAGTKVTHD